MERSDFPIVCETCLGPNPYIRMQKNPMSKECKVCSRPMTVFRWKPGSDARYKQTVACQICAKLKNVCQVCLFDLQYGLPVGARDTLLGTQEGTPQSFVNQQYFAEQHELALSDGTSPSATGQLTTNESLLKAARTAPYYKRNAAKICSFFVKGQCTRGDACPFRHELPSDDKELANQKIRDRYHGENDPLARKVMQRIAGRPALKPPSDKSVKTLYIGGVDGKTTTANDITDTFYEFGEIESIRMSEASRCAFLTFRTREVAEAAAQKMGGSAALANGAKVRVSWAKPVLGKRQEDTAVSATPTTLPLDESKPVVYPSQDPNWKGARPSTEVQ